MKRKIRFDRLALVISIALLIVCASVSVINKCVKFVLDRQAERREEVAVTYIYLDEYVVEDSVEYAVEEEVITCEPLSLGQFKLTGYCPCEKCCGQWADGITATGTVATEGRTIAVDPNVIPLGSHVLINGVEFCAEDTGSAINENRIDIYKDSHSACFSEDCNGYAEVYLIH